MSRQREEKIFVLAEQEPAPMIEQEAKPRTKRGRATEAEPIETIQEYFGRLFGKPVKSAEASPEQEEPAVSPVEPKTAPVIDKKLRRKPGRQAKSKPELVEPVSESELEPVVGRSPNRRPRPSRR